MSEAIQRFEVVQTPRQSSSRLVVLMSRTDSIRSRPPSQGGPISSSLTPGCRSEPGKLRDALKPVKAFRTRETKRLKDTSYYVGKPTALPLFEIED